MKATGIVRRIDELGRIVIPKEIRRTFKIKEGTPLEIFCGDNNELVLKKYSMLNEIKDFSDEVCLATFNTLNYPILVCDKDKVLSCCGASKSQFIDNSISIKLAREIEQRREIVKNKLDGDVLIELIENDILEYYSQIIVPIISGGDTAGAIICFSKEQKKLGQCEVQVLKCMASFVAEQIT